MNVFADRTVLLPKVKVKLNIRVIAEKNRVSIYCSFAAESCSDV